MSELPQCPVCGEIVTFQEWCSQVVCRGKDNDMLSCHSMGTKSEYLALCELVEDGKKWRAEQDKVKEGK